LLPVQIFKRILLELGGLCKIKFILTLKTPTPCMLISFLFTISDKHVTHAVSLFVGVGPMFSAR